MANNETNNKNNLIIIIAIVIIVLIALAFAWPYIKGNNTVTPNSVKILPKSTTGTTTSR